ERTTGPMASIVAIDLIPPPARASSGPARRDDSGLVPTRPGRTETRHEPPERRRPVPFARCIGRERRKGPNASPTPAKEVSNRMLGMLALSGGVATLLWIIAVVLVIAGIVTLVRGGL